MPLTERGKYANLLIVCNDCSRTIDSQPDYFTVERLQELKRGHEAWGHRQLAVAATAVDFPELEAVMNQLLSAPVTPTTVFASLRTGVKLQKNQLSSRITVLVTIGMSRLREVEAYVQQRALTDIDYPERLRAGFLAEYDRYRAMHIRGDSLFEALSVFASGGAATDGVRYVAGVMVLTYLFDRCELFES